jgi:hypothetical protein
LAEFSLVRAAIPEHLAREDGKREPQARHRAERVDPGREVWS